MKKILNTLLSLFVLGFSSLAHSQTDSGYHKDELEAGISPLPPADLSSEDEAMFRNIQEQFAMLEKLRKDYTAITPPARSNGLLGPIRTKIETKEADIRTTMLPQIKILGTMIGQLKSPQLRQQLSDQKNRFIITARNTYPNITRHNPQYGYNLYSSSRLPLLDNSSLEDVLAGSNDKNLQQALVNHGALYDHDLPNEDRDQLFYASESKKSIEEQRKLIHSKMKDSMTHIRLMKKSDPAKAILTEQHNAKVRELASKFLVTNHCIDDVKSIGGMEFLLTEKPKN